MWQRRHTARQGSEGRGLEVPRQQQPLKGRALPSGSAASSLGPEQRRLPGHQRGGAHRVEGEVELLQCVRTSPVTAAGVSGPARAAPEAGERRHCFGREHSSSRGDDAHRGQRPFRACRHQCTHDGAPGTAAETIRLCPLAARPKVKASCPRPAQSQEGSVHTRARLALELGAQRRVRTSGRIAAVGLWVGSPRTLHGLWSRRRRGGGSSSCCLALPTPTGRLLL
mmetsp:Transcript_25908/g.69997  ORF Transcript_25908/g.69997 Transcript_25908/m.69997 type:complete len:225 (-) Transcript_25908:2181-2855(-)